MLNSLIEYFQIDYLDSEGDAVMSISFGRGMLCGNDVVEFML